MILDITFYEENKLVDQEFPEDCSPFRIQQLLQDLTEPEVLAGRLAPAQEVCICVSQKKNCVVMWLSNCTPCDMQCIVENLTEKDV